MNLPDLDDIALIDQFKQSRDPALIEQLYQRYAKKVYWWAIKFLKNSLEAEEVVQDIFIALLGNALENYTPREEAKFSSWLYRCVGNQCLKRLRTRTEALNNYVEIQVLPQELIDKLNLEDTLLLTERTALLTASLNRLSPMQRICCLKFYWDGMKYDDIAAELGVTYDQVRSHLQNALRNLRFNFRETRQHVYEGKL